jgi:hypothetical protein
VNVKRTNTLLRIAAAVAASSLLLAASASADEMQAPDANQIFARARTVWDTQAYPTRIDYVVTVRVAKDGVAVKSHYEAEYSPVSADLHVVATSDEQLAQAHVAEGINVRITRQSGGKTTMSIPVNAESPADYLGVPLLDPTYSFGLAHARGPAAAEELEAPPAAGEPGVIGSVVARARTYDVTYVGLEDYPLGRAHHLALRPLRDPSRYRLRELWVDARNFATVKAITEGNFADGPGTRVTWTTTFQTVDGTLYIDTEKANAPLRYGAQRFDEASISFEAIAPHHGMPAPKFLFSQLPVRNALTEPKQ